MADLKGSYRTVMPAPDKKVQLRNISDEQHRLEESQAKLNHDGYSTAVPVDHSDETFEDRANRENHEDQKNRNYEDLYLQDVSYTVKVWPDRWYKGGCFREKIVKQVLNNISGVVKQGQITAVLGNSGSGKTSLLDVLAGRTEGTVQGNITLHNQPLSPSVFRRLAGYVIQADRLLPNLTVEETLTYTAQLKFLGEFSQEQIEEKVTTAINDMGLRHIRQSRIGGMIIRGISGGEKRRVSVAIQLLQDPELLLLDEPTTGLDSFTARRLIQSLADLAHRKNKIILLSIHQPRSELFPMFDQVALLSQGEMVYFGPRDAMVSYFTALGHPCPTYANPLDFYLDIASIDHRDHEREETSCARVGQLQTEYKQSAIYTDMVAQTQDSVCDLDYNNSHSSRCCHLQDTLRAAGIILRRMTLNLSRDRSDIGARLTTIVAYAFFLWIFLVNLKNDLSSIQDRAGIFYQSCSACPMVGLLNAVALFPSMRSLYYREAGDGLYGSSSFLVAFFVHILPFHIISSLIYSIWAYWGLGLYPDAGRFGKYYVLMVLLQMFGELQTVLMMAIVDSPALASSISTLIISVSVLSATGLIRATASMPDPIEWFSYITYMKYAVEIVAANEFEGLEFVCPDDSVFPCDDVAETWLDYFFPNSVENMGRNYAITVAYLFGFYVMILLVFKLHKIKHLH